MVPELIRMLAAAEEGGDPDIGKLLGQFLQYGIVGVIVLLMPRSTSPDSTSQASSCGQPDDPNETA
ncbi:hypothetical protein ACFWOL_18540 [Streptomyces sp. NPDC058442]|uniref:hypothetical protein n=1 Tax=Streptomyces sp. NPDC058442 TaxID=3346503 RepID=UPI00365853EF